MKASGLKKVVLEPITDVKKGLKGALKPATSEGTGAVFVGAVLSAPIGYLYGKGFDVLARKFPQVLNGIVGKIVKFGLPLLPIYFVKRFKVPLGNLINGTLLGVFVMQIVMEVWALVKGRSNKQTVETPGIEGGNGIVKSMFAEW